ncbi:hypothetical protein [Syntrophomonas palmitatica]|uniref:hypothetical protein n=1 Tax=Syntrophomonas palmitatica TaxID=402877 RepID=UPI0006D1A59A|nr:hypothetical protein [Syntrophomonas palmitatica]
MKDITFETSIKKNIIEKFIWGKKGDIIDDVMTAKFGIVFLEFASMEEMMTKTEVMNELIRVQVC